MKDDREAIMANKIPGNLLTTAMAVMPHTDVDRALETALSLDVYTNGEIFSSYAASIRKFLDRGGVLVWGIVPTGFEAFAGWGRTKAGWGRTKAIP